MAFNTCREGNLSKGANQNHCGVSRGNVGVTLNDQIMWKLTQYDCIVLLICVRCERVEDLVQEISVPLDTLVETTLE